jgi:hypothetical protein
VATTPYHDLASFKGATLAPASYVDAIEAIEPGWTLGRLVAWSAWINSRLTKRYAAPFAAPYPETVTGWLERLVSWEVYLKRGLDATDQQIDRIEARHNAAQAEVREASSAVDNLFELPLRADTTAGGITKGAPLGYSEVSPYTFSGVQRELAKDEG